jgi:hypothetical protein
MDKTIKLYFKYRKRQPYARPSFCWRLAMTVAKWN